MSKERRPKSGALPQDSASKEEWAAGHQRVASFGVRRQESQNRDVHKSLEGGLHGILTSRGAISTPASQQGIYAWITQRAPRGDCEAQPNEAHRITALGVSHA